MTNPQPLPFNKEKFLLFVLSGIFVFQATLFAAAFTVCARTGGLKSCPSIGRRYENTFNVMIATTLALLTGGAVAAGATQRKPSSDDPGDASVSDRPPNQPGSEGSETPINPDKSGPPARTSRARPDSK